LFRRRRRRKTIKTAAEAIATTARGTEVDTAMVVFFLADAADAVESAEVGNSVPATLGGPAVGFVAVGESETVLGESGEDCDDEEDACGV